MLTQNRCESNDLGMQGMCGHKQIGIWEVSNITVVVGNVDSTCHQPVIYDVVTVNNCYL